MAQRKRVVLYGRVSSMQPDAPLLSRSVSDQLDWLRDWAKREKRQVVAELRDDGVSASRYGTKTRPGWQAVLDLITTGEVDELAVWELSRATRDRAVWTALVAACIDSNVHLAVNGTVHDPTDADSAFMLDLGAALAVRESAVTSKRTKRASAARAANGKPHGRLPDGYLIERDADGKPVRRVLDPDRAPIIKEIARRLLAGESAYGIAADLNGLGITTRTGKPWRGGNIVNRMRSPTLAGLRVHHGKVVGAADWPKIVEPEDHARLLALLADPRRKTNKEGPGVRHLLSGIALCAVCGAPCRTITGYRPDGSRRVRYGCSKAFCVQRAAEPVDHLVEAALLKYLSRPDILAELTEHDAEREAAAGEVVLLRAQLDQARVKVDSGEIGLDDFAYFRTRWEPKLADAEARARPRWLPGVVVEVAGADARARWEATPMTGRRAIVKALLVVTILPTARGNQHTPFNPAAIKIQPIARLE